MFCNLSSIVGESSLSGKFDIIRVDLQASEQYKSVSFSIKFLSVKLCIELQPQSQGYYYFSISVLPSYFF